jgi:hypothetical protein
VSKRSTEVVKNVPVSLSSLCSCLYSSRERTCASSPSFSSSKSCNAATDTKTSTQTSTQVRKSVHASMLLCAHARYICHVRLQSCWLSSCSTSSSSRIISASSVNTHTHTLYVESDPGTGLVSTAARRREKERAVLFS